MTPSEDTRFGRPWAEHPRSEGARSEGAPSPVASASGLILVDGVDGSIDHALLVGVAPPVDLPPEPGSLAHTLEHLMLKAAPGHRPGGTEDRRQRAGCPEEVIVPLLIRPAVAVRVAAEHNLFDPPIAGLRPPGAGPTVDRSGISWTVAVRQRLRSATRATLRITGSPSGNVTVLQLLPVKPAHFGSRRFIRAGLGIASELGGRLYSLTRPVHLTAVPTLRPE